MGLFSNLLDNIKAVFSSARWQETSMRTIEGFGTRGTKARPFDPASALRQFQSWVYAAAMLNANAVAGVPLRLYARKRPGDKLYQTRRVFPHTKRYLRGQWMVQPSDIVRSKAAAFGDDVEEVVEPHPALRLLRDANPWFNGYDMTALRMIYLQTTGNAFMHVVSGQAGAPAELWPMPSQWVKVVPDKMQWVKGYEYGIEEPNKRVYAPDEVVHWRMPNPKDLHYGMGWVEAAWTAIALHAAKRDMDVAKFENMARPDWLLIFKGGDAASLDRLESKIDEKLRGTKKAGRFLTMKGATDVTIQNLQWQVDKIGSPDEIVDEIAAVSGVPSAMLRTTDPNRASSESARYAWRANTIQAYCQIDEQVLNQTYLPKWGISDDAFLAYDPAALEDRQFELKRRVGLVSGGIMTPNEARAEDGYAPIEGGDDLYQPAGNTGGAAALSGDADANQPQTGTDTRE